MADDVQIIDESPQTVAIVPCRLARVIVRNESSTYDGGTASRTFFSALIDQSAHREMN